MLEQHITITKQDHQGQPLLSYPGKVVFDDGHVVVARCIFEPADTELGDLTFRRGDILIECYYRQQPFNIFAIYSPQGRLKGWYCNVLEHTHFSSEAIRWSDLALDLLVLPDGSQIVLDQDEFEELLPSPAQRVRAEQALQTLTRWAAQGLFPFDLPG